MVRIACFSRWALALVVALVAIGMSYGYAAAAPRGPDKPGRGNPVMEAALKIERERLTIQDLRLGRAADYAAKIDALIVRLKAKGKDTADIEKALAAFRASLGQARGEWQSASDTLSAHAGFNGAGKVTDPGQARATLETARADMQQVHEIMRGAYKDLRAALIAYRKAHHTPAEPPTPVEP